MLYHGDEKMARSKDTAYVDQVVTPIPYAELAKVLLAPEFDYGPRAVGRVDLIVLRPDVNLRKVVPEAVVDVEHGIHGSGWVKREERGLVDQICVMSSRVIREIAGDDRKNWPPAGDNLFVDMDLSKKNLPVGTRVRIGNVEAVVTTKPHNGCVKFSKRYGMDALKLVNSPVAKQRRLRGIYFSVVKPGVVKEGDEIMKIADPRKSPTAEDAEPLDAVVPPVPYEVLRKTLLGPDFAHGPASPGRVDLIVLRPSLNEREVVGEAVMSPEHGLHGSGWAEDNRGMGNQVCVMSSSVIRAIAGDDKKNWAPAGDNLFVDMDLSKKNLPEGTKVRLGSAEAVVTTDVHHGCTKFGKRYGIGALNVVNSAEGVEVRLRGIHFQVLKAGVVKEGDQVVKIE